MAKVYPKDTEEKYKERKSFQILLSLLDMKTWDFIGFDKNDHGVDCSFEYIENNEYHGFRILGQLKSSSNLRVVDSRIVFDFPVGTANYAIGCSQPFLFFLVDLSNREAFYLPLQDFFIANPDKMIALNKNESTIRVFIPNKNKVGDERIREIAKCQYSLDEKNGLRRTR